MEVVVVFFQFVSELMLLVTCDCRIAETVEVVFFQFAMLIVRTNVAQVWRWHRCGGGGGVFQFACHM